MEETTKREQLILIKELTQGKKLASQLSTHLLSSSSSSSHETNESLIQKILSSYEKALSILNLGPNVDSHFSITPNGSPKSEVLDQEDNHKDVFKKRKIMPRWTEQVKVCSGTGLDGSLDDGYGWRKYGQKDILGAKFPRGYYRCTHRHVQGCLATKQVQRSDEDPTIFEVTYKGRHTCAQPFYLNKVTTSKVKKMDLGENLHIHCHENNQPQQETIVEHSPDTFFGFGAELEVKMEDIFPPFCFPSPSENEANNNNIFSETMAENHFLENFSSCHQLGGAGIGQNLQTSESDITEIVSAPTSVTNSPLVDLDLFFDMGDFQTNFSFNTLEFFSS